MCTFSLSYLDMYYGYIHLQHTHTHINICSELPSSWGSGPIRMSRTIRLASNYFTGSLPDTWNRGNFPNLITTDADYMDSTITLRWRFFCSRAPVGYYCNETCLPGSDLSKFDISSISRDSSFLPCSNPNLNEYVTTSCTTGTYLDKGADIKVQGCSQASNPETGKYVSSLCTPGNFTSTGMYA